MTEPVIIPSVNDAKVGMKITFDDKSFTVDEFFSQGKEMVGKGYTHIMFSRKGAFGMVEDK